MNIAHEKVVSINYTLKDDDGNTLDSSNGGEPLTYIQGMGNIIPGLEAALVGKAKGDTLNVSIPPPEAYGEFDEALILRVPREQFTGVENLQIGMQFSAHSPNGDQVVTVTKIEEEMVTVDGNHPLAGKTLHFDVAVVDVREAIFVARRVSPTQLDCQRARQPCTGYSICAISRTLLDDRMAGGGRANPRIGGIRSASGGNRWMRRLYFWKMASCTCSAYAAMSSTSRYSKAQVDHRQSLARNIGFAQFIASFRLGGQGVAANLHSTRIWHSYRHCG